MKTTVDAATEVSLARGLWQERPAYWATIAYIREWWSRDGLYRGDIARRGRLTEKVLRRIAVEYNFNRGIVGATQDGDKSAKQLCRILNEDCSAWPHGLIDRAHHCLHLLARAKKQSLVHGNQVSGMSKLMWFLRPDNWTLFDRFAVTGAGIRSGGDTCERMMAYYQELARRDFSETVSEMQAVLDGSRVPPVPAPRVVDTFLMIKGGAHAGDFGVNGCEDFLDLLPLETRKAIEGLATDVQKSVHAAPLFSNQPN